MLKKDLCEICGTELDFVIRQEDYKELFCEFCKKIFKVNIFCPNGHYICDSCHSEDPIKIINNFCKKTKLKDPYKIAERIMSHPKFKLYGNEHHALTPAVILTTLKNNSILKPNGKEITVSDIEEAISRGSKIPGGYCGFYGSCGAGIGSGIAVTIFMEATPSTNIPRSLANEMTSRSLIKISDNLEHCCKRSVKLSINEALEFLKDKFNIKLNFEINRCEFAIKNKKCSGGSCPFF